jgi:hypothetical protein
MRAAAASLVQGGRTPAGSFPGAGRYPGQLLGKVNEGRGVIRRAVAPLGHGSLSSNCQMVVRVSQPLRAEIERAAEEEGRTVADVIRVLLADALAARRAPLREQIGAQTS